MDVIIIVGNFWFTKLLFIIALLFVTADLLATLFTVFYQKYIYDRFYRKKYDISYSPHCSIIVPCKGIPKNLGKNLQAFLDLDYPDYQVIYTVESEDDAAVPTIKEIMAENNRALLAVAGLSTTCVQKNHNLIAGLELAKDTDVYVFADADIKPDPKWLRELVMPLSNNNIAVTSGFRWLNARKGTIGELTHMYINVVMYIVFTTACFIGGVGLWGGSMAIRRKDFEELDVAERWKYASVDDMSLSAIALKARRKAVVVPHCIIQTDDLLQTVHGSISWFERQIMYLKAYQKGLWLFPGYPVLFSGVFLTMYMPVALLLSFLPGHTFFSLGGGATLLFYVGELLTISLYPILGSMKSFHKFVLLWPFLRLTHGVSYVLTIITNTITWAGIKYRLDGKGDVTSIQRPEGSVL